MIEKSIHGQFERFELSPGAITFYIGSQRAASIKYDLYGYLPGSYRTVPTVVRNAYRPEQLAVATPKPLKVLPSGAASADPYRLTPMELLEFGKHSFAKGDLKTAGQHLTELLKNWNLRPEIYREVIETLLDVHLELGPPDQVVHYFEIVKEKWPDKEIPFAKIMKVAAAYHEMGEYERSYLVFRATVEGSFLRETGVAGFLESQGHFLRSVDVLGRLLREYPPEGYVAAATYALAQHVYAKAPSAAEDPLLRKAKVNRVDLLRRAGARLEAFLTEYPDDPAADQAALAAASVLLDRKAYKEAAAACDRYAARYPKSELLDAFWYVIGYCRFAGGEDQAALEMCRKVAEAKRIDAATGREVESRNKWQAIYILGQVYHSLGQAADAIREYRLVEDKFADARQSIDYFLRKVIELPEVVTVKPGEPAEMELKFRNVAACDLKVYRIDLMKFSLLKRNLGGITQINLAGIRPQHEAAVELGDGKDYRDRTKQLSLPLKDEGAYLVVCRGDDLHASGLVLVSPLAVEVQEDSVSGRVRTTAKDSSGKYLPEVHVKVIGSRNTDFVAGQTDLRGVFVADGIQGAVTVIAQSGSARYAFYRAKGSASEEMLARQEEAAPANAAAEPAAPATSPENPVAARPQPRHEAAPRRPAAIPLPTPEAIQAAQAAATQSATPSAGISLTERPGDEKIKKALAAPTQCDFVETPLQDALDYFKRLHGIEIQIDKKALDDVGIGGDTPITKNIKGIPLRSALRLILKEHSLTSIIQDNALLITTPEEADNRLETKIYPVSDLVLPPNSTTESEPDFDSLIDMIKNTVKPTSWDDTGGIGTISEFENHLGLVISETQEVHEEIEDFLAALRNFAREQAKAGLPPFKRRSPADMAAERARRNTNIGAGMGGMMGGMGGGMGGMTATPPAAGQGGRPFVTSVIPVIDGQAARGPARAAPANAQQADLLQGVRGINQANQGQQSQNFRRCTTAARAASVPARRSEIVADRPSESDRHRGNARRRRPAGARIAGRLWSGRRRRHCPTSAAGCTAE